ncbi:hypothetical protein AHF37_10508, partial [Paragonimus kellicotti]
RTKRLRAAFPGLGLRNRGLRNKFILKPAENLSAALMKARGCEALEQLDEKRAAEESLCLAFSQHSLNPKQIPPPNRPAVPTGDECWYCQRFGRRARHCGHNPLNRSSSRKGESLITLAFNMKTLSVRYGTNEGAALFLVDTEASCSLIRAQLAARLTEHRNAPVKPVRLFAANGTEMRVASSLSARVQLGSFSGEHQFLACPNLQWEVILGMDFLGRFGGVLNLKNSQMTIGSCVVGLKGGRPTEVCSAFDSKTETSFETEVLNPLRSG